MLLGWGLLLPAGVISARFLKYKGPIWFHVHRALQIGGLIVASAGWIIALVKFNVFIADARGPAVIHGSIGIVTMCVGLLQPVNAFFRPHATDGPKSFIRLAWEILHKTSGWTALFLAVVTICLGIPLIGPRIAFTWAYGAIFFILALFGLFIIRDKSKSKQALVDMPNESPKTVRDMELTG
jgi:preprotein translocase subunit SecG